MKRKLSASSFFLSFFLFCFVFSGCAKETYKGTIVSSVYPNRYFELDVNGTFYGFIIAEETKINWNDSIPTESLDVYLQATVVAEEEAEPATEDWDCIEKWFYAKEITVTGIEDGGGFVDYKPVIYLYPTEEKKITVTLDLNGRLTCVYPAYEDGWTVTAYPDGTLVDERGQTYNYLYWEGVTYAEYDFSSGFCVAGKDTAAFLERSLAELGLTRREANEFIVYWLPQMQDNAYNLISFQTENYASAARLSVDPAPDTLIRVFMAWKPSDTYLKIEEQELASPERIGFTVVEWGGTRIFD